MDLDTGRFLLISVVGISFGVGVSLLGTFIILRRMALVGDALSHVALPGIALATIYGINPFLGAFAFLILAVVVITLLEKYSLLPIDALVGVFFTTSLGVGALLSPSSEHLLEALFGDIAKITVIDAQIAVIIALLVVLATVKLFRDLAMVTLSKEMAHSEGVAIERTELFFLLLLAVMITLGIRIIGTLLIGALVIIPASAAKNVSSNLRSMAVISVAIGILTILVGSAIAVLLQLAPGPIITIVAAAFFVLSLAARK